MYRTLMIVAIASLAGGCTTQVRQKLPLENWDFSPDKSPQNSTITAPPQNTGWTRLSIPHVFRLSGLPDDSAGWYKTTFKADTNEQEKCFYLFLEGAASVADVFVNGTHVGQHRGAYTAAAFDLTNALKFGQDNELLVRVTNRDTEAANCLSQSNLYYTNGGMYRPAWLIKTGGVHIYPDMGSTGVYLTGRNITSQTADLEIKTCIRNATDQPAQVLVRHLITDPDGKESHFIDQAATVPAKSIQPLTVSNPVENVKLWDIGKPNLYTVTTDIIVSGRRMDRIIERTGFRTIEMKDNSFILNGSELLSRGVCKHHQGEYQWNAMTDADLLSEWKGILDLGCNTVRLAHYPHRRFEYHLADENGIAVWAETGLAGQKWDKGVKRETTPNADGERITREMVRQNWNHPSILFWSSGNETYQEVASHYADIIRQEDTTRLITYASAGERPSNVDFLAGNTYQGWYYAHYTDFQKLPDNAFVSETGSGSWLTHHVPYGTVQWTVDKFEPEEYNELFAEFRLQTIFRDNPDGHKMFLWWNFREFYNLKFKNNRNTKGILTLAGMPKDYYYLFRSFLRPADPVLHLCGRHHFYRQFAADNGIKVYSNAPQAELIINGVSQGIHKNGEYAQPDTTKKTDNRTETVKGIVVNNVFYWKAALKPGKNIVEVSAKHGTESMVIYQQSANGPMPVPENSLVADLTSSNNANPAIFIDRPVENQGPFYTEADGSSDNTFDILPASVEGCSWIATKRLSDAANRTDLRFKLTKPATVFVMYSTGTFPPHTLKQPDAAVQNAAAELEKALTSSGFALTADKGVWRGHDCWLADYQLMRLDAKAGQTVSIPGQTLDYVVLIAPAYKL
jgi:beta-galactosidase